MHTFGIVGWGVMLIGFLIFVLVIIGLAIFIVWAVRQGKESRPDAGMVGALDTPENILKARYARGEITREEYISIFNEIKG